MQKASRSVRYRHLDRLGSLEAATTETGAEDTAYEHGYDAFGGPRSRDWQWSGDEMGQTDERGFTGHEHLDNLRLIHMNGRVYDYKLGRFLSVDPMISKPADSQSINPYSYIGNNPLSGTDPTGYFSTGQGCGKFSECDVTLVNPSDSSKRLYLGARDITIVDANGHEHTTLYVPGSNKGVDEAVDRAGSTGDVKINCGCSATTAAASSVLPGRDTTPGTRRPPPSGTIASLEEAKDRALPGQYKRANTVADLLVISNGAVPSNPFGHVAIAVTGAGVFSYGMEQVAPGSPVEDYIASQIDKRNTTAYVIPTTPEQNAAALHYLSAAMREPYNVINNNCAVVCNAVLDVAGVGHSGFVELAPEMAASGFRLPVSIADRAALSAAKIIEFPKNAGGIFPLDPTLQQFDPAPKK